MAIAPNSTCAITWRSDGVTIAFTPAGGSTITFSCSADKVGRAIDTLIGDDLRSGNAVQTVTNKIAATTVTRGPNVKHLDF